MIEVKEVLRRREAGQGLREVARETDLDRKTVRRYVDAAGEASAELSPEVRVQQAVQSGQVLAPQPRSEARERLDPHRELISSWQKPADGSTRAPRLTKVHVLLQRRGVDVTYATLCRWAHDELGWRERKPTVRVDDPEPGVKGRPVNHRPPCGNGVPSGTFVAALLVVRGMSDHDDSDDVAIG